jgi:hypothetical protein
MDLIHFIWTEIPWSDIAWQVGGALICAVGAWAHWITPPDDEMP